MANISGTWPTGNVPAKYMNFDSDGRLESVTDTPPPAPTVFYCDDKDAGFSVTGVWGQSSDIGYSEGYKGSIHWSPVGDGSSSATFSFTGLTPGTYRISATWDASSNRANNSPFSINGGASILVNQRVNPVGINDRGVNWQDLASTYVLAGTVLTVKLTNQAAPANCYVIADAIRIERIG